MHYTFLCCGVSVVLIVIMKEKIFRIREYYDFSELSIFELIESHWVDAWKSRNNQGESIFGGNLHFDNI